MIDDLIKSVARYLPLRIERSEWRDPVLSIGGANWSFNTTSSWRVVNDLHLIVGSEDDLVSEVITSLIGADIESCEPMSKNPDLDPRFILSNGTKLEIFSASGFEPWVLRLPGDEPTIVATPSE